MPLTIAPARTSGATLSSWLATAAAPTTFAPLRENIMAEVVAAGAGITGLTTAYLLGKAGKKVVVLEDGELASGENGCTTAHLSNALDDRYTTLEQLFGAQGARMVAESYTAAITPIEQVVAAEDIDCNFLRLNGYLFLPKNGAT
jgi:glycine/D-amino acid oxidase-like deaminating enzyme